MILSKQDIYNCMMREDDKDPLIIEPFEAENMQPASYDVTLSRHFRYGPGGKNELNASGLDIAPGHFYLGSTKEWFEIPLDLALRIEGKSTWGRLGLIVHVTAGFVDPGFKGNLTLELYNLSSFSIPLKEGDKIAQVSLSKLLTPVLQGYKGRYQNSHGTIAAREEI